jgi:hypothetical protein
VDITQTCRDVSAPPVASHHRPLLVDENIAIGSLSERSRLRRALANAPPGGTKVSGVVSLQKLHDRAEHRAFQHLLKSTLLPHDLRDAVGECHHLRVVAKIRINAA